MFKKLNKEDLQELSEALQDLADRDNAVITYCPIGGIHLCFTPNQKLNGNMPDIKSLITAKIDSGE